MTAAVVLVTACGGGEEADRDAGSTTTAFDPRVEGASDDRIWGTGEAHLVLGEERFDFALDFCALQPVDPEPGATTVTLQVDGTATGDAGTTLRVVETHTHDGPVRIQVVSVRFEDATGSLARTWEAQRVVDLETGEVDDMHGEGTSPLLDVTENGELAVTAAGATFWQFDMTGGEDRVAGTGTLEAVCRPS